MSVGGRSRIANEKRLRDVDNISSQVAAGSIGGKLGKHKGTPLRCNHHHQQRGQEKAKTIKIKITILRGMMQTNMHSYNTSLSVNEPGSSNRRRLSGGPSARAST